MSTEKGRTPSQQDAYAKHFQDWVCPQCNKKPEGHNYPVKFIDTTHGMSLIEWVGQGGRQGYCWDTSERAVATVEEMVGHITIYEGCFQCFDREIASNPIIAHLFKVVFKLHYKLHRTIPLDSDGCVFTTI